MKYFALLLCVVLTAAACEKDDEAPARLDLSTSEILLRGDASEPGTFAIEASTRWTLQLEGDGFMAEPLSGQAGSTAVSVRASAQNRNSERRELGAIEIRLSGSRRVHRVAVHQGPMTAPQSVFLYMAGSDLLRFFKMNIDRSRQAVTRDMPGDGRFLALVQPRTGEALVIEVSYDAETRAGKLDTLRRYSDIVTTRRETMARLLAEMAEVAPARNYGLILGSHATGWVPASHPYLAPERAGSAPDDYWSKHGLLPTRWFGIDHSERIEISDLAGAIRESGVRFEYLIFDACFMSSVEALYDLRTSAEYIVASPSEVMGYGFPYDRVLPQLFRRNGSACDLEQVCRIYRDFYLDDWDSLTGNAQSACVALTVCSELDGLAQAMRAIQTSNPRAADLATLQYYEALSPHLFFDLGQYAMQICNDPALAEQFRAQFDRAFPESCRLHTPSFYSAYGSGGYIPIRDGGYSGVTTGEPSSRYVSENQATAWYRATH